MMIRNDPKRYYCSLKTLPPGPVPKSLFRWLGEGGGASAEHRGGGRASHLTDPGSILGVSKIFLRNLNLLRFIDSSALLGVWTVRGKVA